MEKMEKKTRINKDLREEKRKRITFRGGFLLFLAVFVPLFFLIFYPLPQKKDNEYMLTAMSEYNTIFNHQSKLNGAVKDIRQRISGLNLSIKQIQKVDDIKSDTRKIEKNKNAAAKEQKHRYNLAASQVLKIHFEVRELLASYQNNNSIVFRDLEKCKAHIPDGSLARAPY